MGQTHIKTLLADLLLSNVDSLVLSEPLADNQHCKSVPIYSPPTMGIHEAWRKANKLSTAMRCLPTLLSRVSRTRA